MNKDAFVRGVAEECGLDPNKGKDRALVDTVIFKGFAPFIKKTLAAEDKLTIANFISFKTSIRKARKGRNPATGETIDVPEKRSVRTRLHQSLIEQ
jgi:DNA-binding protein HU-beta